jgi:hypothetical protein
MGRDASPKRSYKRDTGADIQVFNLIKEYCDFTTLVVLYATAKVVWPLFSNFNVRAPCAPSSANYHLVFVPALEFWQHLLQCCRYRTCTIWGAYEMECSLLPAISAALCGRPKGSLMEQPGFRQDNETVAIAALLNGNLEFYEKYVKGCDVEDTLRDRIDDSPPLFSGTLNAYLRRKFRPRDIDLCEFLHYLGNAITLRSVYGLIHANTMLRRKFQGITLRAYFMKHANRFEKAHAGLVSVRCREWGHPKALRLIETFLAPLTKEK